MKLSILLGRAAAFFALAFPAAIPAAPFAYAVQTTDVADDLLVVDLAAQRLAAKVPVDLFPLSVAISPSGTLAYVTHPMVSSVTAVDLTTNRAVKYLDLGFAPAQVIFNRDGTRAYVASTNIVGAGYVMVGVAVAMIDTANHSVLKTVYGHANPFGMALDNDGGRLYVVNNGSNSMSVHDASTMDLVRTFPVPLGPAALAIDEARNRLYLSHVGPEAAPRSTLSVLDPATGQVLETLAVGRNPAGLTLDPSGSRLYVANNGSNSVSVVDVASNQVVATIGVGERPLAVAFHPAGSPLYVLNNFPGTVSVVDPVAMRVTNTIDLGDAVTVAGPFVGPYTTLGPTTPGIVSGIWYNPDESGWGVQLTQRRDTVFATWYTYGPSGTAKWYAMDTCRLNAPCLTCVANASCTGEVYETTGPRYFGMPYDMTRVRTYGCGNLRIDFQTSDKATLTYTVSGQTRSIPIKRYVFRAPATMPAVDYTDMWWNASESGWGLSVTHQQNVMFLAWYVYDDSGNPTWYAVSNCAMSGNTCTGELHRYSGPPWGPSFNAAMVSPRLVGSATATFTDRDNGTLSFTVEGVAGSKQIRRYTF